MPNDPDRNRNKWSAFSPAALARSERISFLLKDSVVYGGAAAISRAFSLITFPLLARHFSVADYGTLDLFLVVSGFLATLMIFGQDSAVARYFYEYQDAEERRALISQSLMLQLGMCAVLLPAIYLASGILSSWMSSADQAAGCFELILLQVPFMVAINFSQNLLKWTFSRGLFLAMSIGYAAALAVALLVTLHTSEMSIQGVLLVNLAASAMFGLLGLYFVRHWLVISISVAYLKELIPFALPIGLICVAGAFSPAFERNLIEHLLGAESLGLYSAGSKVAMLMTLVVGSFQTAWGPFSTSIFREKDASETFNHVLKVFCLAVCVLALLLDMVAKPLLTLLASDRYERAVGVIFLLAMAAAIQSVSWITEVGIGFSKRSVLNLYAHLLFLGALGVGMVLLVPTVQLPGVALAVLVAQAIRSLFASWLAQKAYPMSWEYRPVVLMLLFTATTGILVRRVSGDSAAGMRLAMYAVAIILLLTYFWRLHLDVSAKARLVAFFRR